MNKPTTVPHFAPPAFVAAARAEFDALLRTQPDLQYIDAVLADICGALRGKRLPIAEAGRLFESGMQIPKSIYLMDAHGEMANPFGRGVSDGDPDGTSWPIPGTLARLGGDGAGRAQVLMTLRDDDGSADPAEPRAMLEHMIDLFAASKLTPVAALELEFYLLDVARDPDGSPQPPLCPRSGLRDRGISVYGIDDLDRYDEFLNALASAAKIQGVPLSAASKEYAPGQFEANLKHQKRTVSAADHAIFLKQIIKTAAHAQGFQATFMAKPYADRPGSGLHIHLSLLDENGQNIFDNGRNDGSEQLHQAVAGLQALMPESMALFAPNVNSYRRFQPDMFAPVNRRWGYNNRSTGLRIPAGPGDARRVEHRVAGADANPYLALACVLAGIHHGLTAKLDPGPAATGNVSREPDMTLPFTLDDALSKLAQAATLNSYFGEQPLSFYRETKRIESCRLRRIITAAEYDWYL
ncbi:MAG: glutamine synthetase family protein [Rhizomicrobium sp.]|jgi:glutamine synthetase